jgi:hypothetical protein
MYTEEQMRERRIDDLIHLLRKQIQLETKLDDLYMSIHTRKGLNDVEIRKLSRKLNIVTQRVRYHVSGLHPKNK